MKVVGCARRVDKIEELAKAQPGIVPYKVLYILSLLPASKPSGQWTIVLSEEEKYFVNTVVYQNRNSVKQ